MKLTTPESIQENEKEFIDTINAELDWDAIENLLLEKHGFTVQDEVDYKDGSLVVHNNEIAYKFDFEIKVPLSVLFNRKGECLEITTQRQELEDDDLEIDDEFDALEADALDPADGESAPHDHQGVPDKITGSARDDDPMASDIAHMISEINQPGE